jgi:hypothetical protein
MHGNRPGVELKGLKVRRRQRDDAVIVSLRASQIS